MNDENKNSDNKKKNFNRSKRRRRPYNKNKSQNKDKKVEAKSNNSRSSEKKTSSRNSNKRSHHKKKRRFDSKTSRSKHSNNRSRNEQSKPEPLRAGNIFNAYFVQLKNYLKARNKFHSKFREKVDRRSKRYKDDYERSLGKLRKFQKDLKHWQIDELNQHINILPADTQYSTENPGAEILDIKPEKVPFFSHHETEVQKSREAFSDTEETTGTMEDYEKYKSEIALLS